MLTVPEVARLLRIGRAAAYELINRKDFPTIRISRTIRVLREDVDGKNCKENFAAGVEKIILLENEKVGEMIR